MTLLRTDHGIGVPDVPPGSTYYLPRYDEIRETAARLSFEQGLGDRVAWIASFEPESAWKLDAEVLRADVSRRRRRRKAERVKRRDAALRLEGVS